MPTPSLYLHSLDRYADLPHDALVLPSHGRPFVGLHERIAQQQHQHHKDHLADVLSACAQLQSTADIVPVLFKRQLDLHQLTFAMDEALAHLHSLYFDGWVSRRTDADGIVRFVAV